jgi:hypothetical protein
MAQVLGISPVKTATGILRQCGYQLEANPVLGPRWPRMGWLLVIGVCSTAPQL